MFFFDLWHKCTENHLIIKINQLIFSNRLSLFVAVVPSVVWLSRWLLLWLAVCHLWLCVTLSWSLCYLHGVVSWWRCSWWRWLAVVSWLFALWHGYCGRSLCSSVVGWCLWLLLMVAVCGGGGSLSLWLLSAL